MISPVIHMIKRTVKFKEGYIFELFVNAIEANNVLTMSPHMNE